LTLNDIVIHCSQFGLNSVSLACRGVLRSFAFALVKANGLGSDVAGVGFLVQGESVPGSVGLPSASLSCNDASAPLLLPW